MTRLCNVAFARTRLDELTYSYDPDLLGDLSAGDCVLANLRGKKRKGIVTGLPKRTSVKRLSPVLGVVERSLVGAELLSLFRWVGRYYWARLGEVLGQALPAGIGGYRPRATEFADASRLVVCETTEAACTGDRRDFLDNGFRVLCSSDVRTIETIVAFVETRRTYGGVIILLPGEELPKWRLLLCERFGPEFIEYHNEMTGAQKKRAWQQIRSQQSPIAVGIRSCVFAPARRLSGIVVLDEHNTGYKGRRHPAYHARDVAIARARMADCPVLLSSHTLSLETWHNLKTGAYIWLREPSPAGPRCASFVIDMRRHKDALFSDRLTRELSRAFDTGTAILYLNRLGLSRHVACSDCGCVWECTRCRVPLVLFPDRTLLCGLCGQKSAASELCPNCRGSTFTFRAPGIEMLLREVGRLFPQVKTARVESGHKEPQYVVGPGTAWVGTKALLHLAWPASTRLVVAVRFDYDLVVPDFRARERAFQTLYELDRRAGMLGARLVVQTWRPEDSAVRCAVEQDAAGFLNQELSLREELGFPPAKRLALVEFRSRNKEAALKQAERIGRSLGRYSGLDVLGPVSLLTGVARLLVKLPRSTSLDRLITRKQLETAGVEARVGIDPVEV